MTIRYIKLSPTKNITLLVESNVPEAARAEVARRLMAIDRDAEQVGFIEPARQEGAAARLQMSGGEFCGNATISLGLCVSLNTGLKTVPLEVSGADGIVECRIERQRFGYTGTVSMPLPKRITKQSFRLEGETCSAVRVDMPGITHLIFKREAIKIQRGRLRLAAELAALVWQRELGAEALGALFVSGLDGGGLEMAPLLYVPQSGTLVWENGCGSGSAAVGAYLAWQAGQRVVADIAQPGGSIRVAADCTDGAVKKLEITGSVRILNHGLIAVNKEIEDKT